MGFISDHAARHEYNIDNLYVALCTVVSDLEYSIGPKLFDQFYILRKEDDEYKEFFSNVDVYEVKDTDNIIYHTFNFPTFDTGVIAPVSNFVKEGVKGLTMEELFYLVNSMNGIYLPNCEEIEGASVFDVFMGKVDIEELIK